MSLKYVALSWWSTSDVWTDAATGVGRVREERVSRKKVNVRDKVDKSRNRVFSMSFVALGRKVASVKRWVRSHLVGGER